ncbi:hypothetical protein RHSIM_Rhsim10G0065200 [Rhododendron simsii]|uniref:Trichome birefringence-like C-terminal domain-containing protein n=1 Tax=Rhododendron simsii TaxID=118357 RepID=A0A834LC72_RHOSS|nr:hypothetical protein RHSIM_Rhsim10G0065200 [Rhododendron simsii]
MKWRWKPEQCELSHFNAKEFLELVRGKSMAFIGDSMGRNQVESLMCLLANVEYFRTRIVLLHSIQKRVRNAVCQCYMRPIVLGVLSKMNVALFYRPCFESGLIFLTRAAISIDYNFTLGLVWSPNLVKSSIGNHNGSSVVGLFNLYLDKVDEGWTSKIEDFDYLIISVGHWKALRTTFKAIPGIPNFKGVMILRAFSPIHFGSDNWVRGNCSRTTPIGKEEMVMDANNLEYYLTQVDEFRAAEREGRKRGLRFMLLDVFEAMGMKPDGHPQNKREAIADCLHWCLPGPIDSWNEFLLHMLKVEAPRD